MTDFEILSIGIVIGGLLCMFFVGIGVLISDIRYYINNKGELVSCDDDAVLPSGGNGDRCGDNGCDKEVKS